MRGEVFQGPLGDIVEVCCCHGGCGGRGSGGRGCGGGGSGGRGCDDGFGLGCVYFGTVSDVGAFIRVELCWWESGGCCWCGSVILLYFVYWGWENGDFIGR